MEHKFKKYIIPILAVGIFLGALIGIYFGAKSISLAAPSVNILGSRAVVGTSLFATTTGNGHFTASGTLVFLGLGSDGCLQMTTNATVTTTTCAGTGITSWGGSTSSTQTYATSGPLLSISTANGVHTFATLATSSLGLQPTVSWPIPVASTSLAVQAPLILSVDTLSLNTGGYVS